MLVQFAKWALAFYCTGLAYYFEAAGQPRAAVLFIALTVALLCAFLSHRPRAARTPR